MCPYSTCLIIAILVAKLANKWSNIWQLFEGRFIVPPDTEVSGCQKDKSTKGTQGRFHVCHLIIAILVAKLANKWSNIWQQNWNLPGRGGTGWQNVIYQLPRKFAQAGSSDRQQYT
jgi:hypothetical protein